MLSFFATVATDVQTSLLWLWNTVHSAVTAVASLV
jgi:hypothetical protein